MTNLKPTLAALAAALLLAATAGPARAADDATYTDVIDRYEAIRLALLDDSTEGVAEDARAIERAAKALAADFDAGAAGVSAAAAGEARALLPEIADGAAALASASGLKAAREAFKGLSEPMLRYHALAATGGVTVAYCPMADASWLQKDEETIGNPYYGQSMAKCGSFRENTN